MSAMPIWLLRLLQLTIASVVCGAALAFKWTENGLLIAFLGFLAAYAFGVVYFEIADLWSGGALSARLREEQEAYDLVSDTDALLRSKFAKDPGPLWIGNKPRNLIDITPEPPSLDNIADLPRQLKPPAGSDGSGGPER